MITISREQFPYAAYLRVIAIRRNAEENSDSTWATLDDLGAITKVGTDTVIVKNNHDVLVFRKDGTIRLDSNGHPANRKGNGIIEGKENGDGTDRLDPKGSTSRAECAIIIQRFMETFGE